MSPTATDPHPDDAVRDQDGPVPGHRSTVGGRLTALGLSTAFRRDAALALLVAAATGAVVVAVLLVDPALARAEGLAPSHVVVVLVVLLAQALLLAGRRVRPLVCLWSVAVLQLVLVAAVPGGGTVRGAAPFVVAYTCGALLAARPLVRAVLGVVLLETAAVAVVTLVPGLAPVGASGVWPVLGQLLGSVVTYAVGAVVGAYVATHRKYVDLLRIRAAEAVGAQRERTAAAIRAERSRMARELHDIAAHHLAGMVVQSAVVERLIDRDPRAAKEAAAWVRGQGKKTLRDLRLAVGALREPGGGADGAPDDGAPVPGLAALDRLVATARDLGTPVQLVREGRPRELAPIADITFHRIAQEALANAGEHACGAPVRVLLRYGETDVGLEVVNAAAPGRAGPALRAAGHRGFGLIGMGERAQMLGARFDAGPTAAGGWRVAVALPLDRAAPDAAAPREPAVRP